MAVEANYVYTGGRGEENTYNVNLSYNPATGTNYPFSDISRRPFPEWGLVNLGFLEGYSNYHGLETSFTKRFSDRWQASGTYTLAGFWDGTPPPPVIAIVDGQLTRSELGFDVAKDLGGEYSLAAGDQRHRAVFNGIWEIGYRLPGERALLLRLGRAAHHDLRRRPAQRRRHCRQRAATASRRHDRPAQQLRGRSDSPRGHAAAEADQPRRRRSVSGFVEVFNAFNHENYGSYTTQESSASYGQPSFNSNLAYQARMLQLGFRVAF